MHPHPRHPLHHQGCRRHRLVLMSMLPLTASLGHWLSVAQKILSVGQPGFLGRVLKQPFFLFSFNVSSSRKPLTALVLSSVLLLCWDKGVE